MKEFFKYFKENLIQVFSDIKNGDSKKRKKQIPNLLTLIRGIIAPFTIIPAVIAQKLYLAFSLIALCALTDSFDGWYARHFDAKSDFGAILDSICDKLFVLTLTIPLAFTYTEWIIGILIFEIVITIINVYSKLKGYDVHSLITGKIKTIVLDVSIAICYLNFIVPIPELAVSILTVSTNVLQICSIVVYYRFYRQQVSVLDNG